jgi:hypothetical protein
VLLLLVVPVLAGGQSLAEAARKERERREKLRSKGESSGVTLTEEDLAASKGTLANDPETSSEREEADRNKPTSTEPARSRSQAPRQAVSQEAYWRGRVTRARARVTRAEQRRRRIDYMIRIGQPAMYDSNGTRVIYSPQRLKAMADKAQLELESAQQALEDLLEQARRAGALPGWLRE